MANPILKELHFTVFISVFILVPPDSDESDLAICTVRDSGSFSESDLSIPIAITYDNSSVPLTSYELENVMPQIVVLKSFLHIFSDLKQPGNLYQSHFHIHTYKYGLITSNLQCK